MNEIETIQEVTEDFPHDYSPKIHCKTSRLSIPKGWIVITTLRIKNAISVSQIFIEDSAHAWSLT